MAKVSLKCSSCSALNHVDDENLLSFECSFCGIDNVVKNAKNMSEEEIEALVIDAIAQTEAKSMKDIGKVMAVIMPKTKGKADGKVINNNLTS